MTLFDGVADDGASDADRVSVAAPTPTVPGAAENLVRAPLAERMRPRTLDEIVGQGARIGAATPLGKAIIADRAPSLIIWGTPGCGKTTLARVIARHSSARFVALSAVLAGVADVRRVIAQAAQERMAGTRTILFVDEIHRFNKGQQDALLPHVEAGTITLLGATTENPSFAVTSALLSRCQVVHLDAPKREDVVQVIERALGDRERGVGDAGISLDPDALGAVADYSDGDMRRALVVIEQIVADLSTRGVKLASTSQVMSVLRDRTLRHDRAGDGHYNLASAFIKSMRASDPDAALYYCFRMIEAGDDPLFILRRMLIFAAEDVGLAEPRALELVAAADHAFQRVGAPEGFIPIAQAVIYLALAPKSRAAYDALAAVRGEIARSGSLAVPFELRNVVGPDERSPAGGIEGGGPFGSRLPESLRSESFYAPTGGGWEQKVREHLERRRKP